MNMHRSTFPLITMEWKPVLPKILVHPARETVIQTMIVQVAANVFNAMAVNKCLVVILVVTTIWLPSTTVTSHWKIWADLDAPPHNLAVCVREIVIVMLTVQMDSRVSRETVRLKFHIVEEEEMETRTITISAQLHQRVQVHGIQVQVHLVQLQHQRLFHILPVEVVLDHASLCIRFSLIARHAVTTINVRIQDSAVQL